MLTEIFCVADDFCKEFEKEFSKKTIDKQGCARKARPCRLSRSEIITILIFFHHSKFRTFKDYYETLILVWNKSAFHGLVSYSRFVQLAQREVLTLFIFSSSLCRESSTGIHYIDSAPLKVCHNKRIPGNKTFKNVAKRGKSSVGWFFGFKLHFVINAHGEIVNFTITPGNVSDQNIKVIDYLTQNISGKLFGDKGYISSKLFQLLFKKGVTIITKIKRNMKNCFMNFIDKILLKKRGVIESVGNLLKNFCQVEHSRHRSLFGLLLNVFSGIAAYHFKNHKPSIFKSQKNLFELAETAH